MIVSALQSSEKSAELQAAHVVAFCGTLQNLDDAALFRGLQHQGWECAFGGALTKEKAAAVKLVVVTDHNKVPMIQNGAVGPRTLPSCPLVDHIHIGDRPSFKLGAFSNHHYTKRDAVLSLAQGVPFGFFVFPIF